MDTGLVVGIVSCTVPLLMMLLMILSAQKESNNACYSPLFIRLLTLSIFLFGVFCVFRFQRIIDSVLACIPIIVFFVALFAGMFTKTVFENDCILLVTFGIKRRYLYTAIQKVEIHYMKDTQMEQKIIIFFPKKKIRLDILQVGFLDAKNLLIKMARKNGIKLPLKEINRGKSKKNKKQK